MEFGDFSDEKRTRGPLGLDADSPAAILSRRQRLGLIGFRARLITIEASGTSRARIIEKASFRLIRKRDSDTRGGFCSCRIGLSRVSCNDRVQRNHLTDFFVGDARAIGRVCRPLINCAVMTSVLGQETQRGMTTDQARSLEITQHTCGSRHSRFALGRKRASGLSRGLPDGDGSFYAAKSQGRTTSILYNTSTASHVQDERTSTKSSRGRHPRVPNARSRLKTHASVASDTAFATRSGGVTLVATGRPDKGGFLGLSPDSCVSSASVLASSRTDSAVPTSITARAVAWS